MLATFEALASDAGGQKTMDMIAGGISEAPITTETGLVIALPGLIFQYYLSQGRDRYEAFLAHLQTVCTQSYCVARGDGGPAARGRGRSGLPMRVRDHRSARCGRSPATWQIPDLV